MSAVASIVTQPVRRSRMVAGMELLLLGVAIVYFAARVLPQAWRAVNSDFPNYYIAARLTREHRDTSRIYEWVWFQRQKNWMGIDQPLVGTTTLTPFSFVTAIPISYFEPLTAKRVWTIANLLFMGLSAWLIWRITRMKPLYVVAMALLWFPAHANFQLGQMYGLLLLVMTAALWLYLRGHRTWAGALVGVGFGLKIFPVLFGLYFARKRDWRALGGLAAGCVLVVAMTVAVYGPSMSLQYAREQVPPALRGESLDPYNLARESFSAVLHRLFIYEPGLNPRPAINLPVLYAALHPLLQLLVFAPAILFLRKDDGNTDVRKLEWAVFVTAVLATSSNPASYHFTVLLLPAAIVLAELHRKSERTLLALAMVAVVAGVAPWWRTGGYDGWHALLGVPRLYFLLVFYVVACVLLYREAGPVARRENVAWAAILACGCVVSIVGTYVHQQHQYDDYAFRLPVKPEPLLALAPLRDEGGVRYVGMVNDGYALREDSEQNRLVRKGSVDELSFAASGGHVAVEHTTRRSVIEMSSGSETEGFDPAISPDGTRLAFLRDSGGKGTLWVRDLPTASEREVRVGGRNVLDIAFQPDGRLLIVASSGGSPRILEQGADGDWRALTGGVDRYPAISPDGQWIAFSRSNGSVWNLWVRNLATGEERRVTDADCNQITPSWDGDSKSLLYASDCGRGLFLTSLVERRVIP